PSSLHFDPAVDHRLPKIHIEHAFWVQHVYRAPQRRGCNMRISHGHRDSRMTQKRLDGMQRYPCHGKMGCERVPQNVPRDPSQSSLLADHFKVITQSVVIERSFPRVGKDITRASPSPVQQIVEIDVKRDVSYAVILGGDELSLTVTSGMTHCHVDISPV